METETKPPQKGRAVDWKDPFWKLDCENCGAVVEADRPNRRALASQEKNEQGEVVLIPEYAFCNDECANAIYHRWARGEETAGKTEEGEIIVRKA